MPPGTWRQYLKDVMSDITFSSNSRERSSHEKADRNEKLTKESLEGFCGQDNYFLGMVVLCNNTHMWS